MQQHYGNHRRLVPAYHYVGAPLVLIVFIMAMVNLTHVSGTPEWIYTGLMPLLMAIVLLLVFLFARQFANKVQDRAIHAEENFRAFLLTGKPLDSRLKMGQVIALRFAEDEEYLALTQRAIAENMKPDDIKKAIKVWRADHYRC